MQELRKAYMNLYLEYNKKEELAISSVQALMVGKYYQQKESPIRLLLIGRAKNGGLPLQANDADDFASKMMAEYKENHFSDFVFDAEINTIRTKELVDYKDKNGNTIKKYYRFSRSQFWCAAEDIFNRLVKDSHLNLEINPKWVEHIAWSNLYKVAPIKEGNPGIKMQKSQKNACKQILLEEIRVANPTHIIFFTGQDWFDDFQGSLEDIIEYKRYSTNNYVSQWGKIKTGAKYVVCCHPQGKKRETLVAAVSDAFNGTM